LLRTTLKEINPRFVEISLNSAILAMLDRLAPKQALQNLWDLQNEMSSLPEYDMIMSGIKDEIPKMISEFLGWKWRNNKEL